MYNTNRRDHLRRVHGGLVTFTHQPPNMLLFIYFFTAAVGRCISHPRGQRAQRARSTQRHHTAKTAAAEDVVCALVFWDWERPAGLYMIPASLCRSLVCLLLLCDGLLQKPLTPGQKFSARLGPQEFLLLCRSARTSATEGFCWRGGGPRAARLFAGARGG